MSAEIPCIDISPFLHGVKKQGVARQVADACERIGFLMISGHGLEPLLIDNAFERSLAFFDLPRMEKEKFHPTGPSRQRGFHGFATRGLAYTLGQDAPPDLRETFFLGPIDDHRAYFAKRRSAVNAYAPNIYPVIPEGVAEALVGIYRAYERLSADLLRIFAVALDQPENYFAPVISRHFSILSSHHYPALTQAPQPGQLRTGPHTDFGALTILAMTEADGGLEVLMPDGVWQPIHPPDGALVVNLGDMMARWTNDRWASTLHRVVTPAELAGSRSRRQTIGYFMHPDFDARIAAIPSCVAKGGTPKYPPISAGEHIAMKITASHEGADVARTHTHFSQTPVTRM